MAAPTPHIESKAHEIAKTVLMPGDPLRSKFVADNFLSSPTLVNNVRGVQGYTGTWKGTAVTVMASGMGMPSMGIYSWELYNFYQVDSIIRIGSAGALRDDLKVMDIIAAQGACTNSNYMKQFIADGIYAPTGDFKLLSKAFQVAEDRGVELKIGNVLSSDNFYGPGDRSRYDPWKRMGVLAVEMETAALYANAGYAGKRALSICTISDHIYRDEFLSSNQRQTAFSQMIEIALDTAVLGSCS